MVHVNIQSANIEPVFFAYNESESIDAVVAKYIATEPEYDFVAADGFGHKFWVVDDEADIQAITRGFSAVDAFYVADGHHRTAAAARVGAERRAGNPQHTGEEEYNWFMAVAFPQNQLRIMDYNRLVKDLNGHSPAQLTELLSEDFQIEELGSEADRQQAADGFAPVKLHELSMYLEGKWYSLKAKPGRCNDSDPIGVLDVTLLSERVLDRILGIKDLRRDKRIDFVGGIRGLGELARRVDSGEMKIAFALCPVSMKQLIDIADSGNIMPPKTTWFEPKLRSGLAIHLF